MTRQSEDMIVPEGWGFVETIDRRDFLRLTSTGVLVMFAVRPPEGAMRPVWNFAEQQRTPPDFNAFLHIGANGRVTLFVGKIEMGQGIITGLPQIVAEQLNVPLDRVDCVMGDTDLCPFDNGTFGSLSVWRLGPTLHAAAAEARAVLVQMASEKLSVPVADLEVKDGVILAKGDLSKKVTYGELAGGKKIERRYEGQAALEKVSEYTIIGKSYPRRDAVEKVTGKAKYSGDIVPAGALHARVVRPPAHGATITAIDTSAAEKQPGVRVIRDGDLVAVRIEPDAPVHLVGHSLGANVAGEIARLRQGTGGCLKRGACEGAAQQLSVPAEGGEPRKLWAWPGGIRGLTGQTLSPDGRALAALLTDGNWKRNLVVVDATSGRIARSVPTDASELVWTIVRGDLPPLWRRLKDVLSSLPA